MSKEDTTTEISDQKKAAKNFLSSSVLNDQIARAIPEYCKPDRFLRIATTAVLKSPKLLQCSQESILQCLLDLSATGLEPDGRNAHLIPYWDKHKNQYNCKLMVDYKGMVALAKRTKKVLTWKACAVYNNDSFIVRNEVVDHTYDIMSDRGVIAGFYSHVKYANGEEEYDVMPIADIEAIRKRSQSPDNGPWVTDYIEMGKKTVMRRHSKLLDLSPEFIAATKADDEHNFDNMKQTTGREVPRENTVDNILPPPRTTSPAPAPADFVMKFPDVAVTAAAATAAAAVTAATAAAQEAEIVPETQSADTPVQETPAESPPPEKAAEKAAAEKATTKKATKPKPKPKPPSSNKLDGFVAALVAEGIPEDWIIRTLNALSHPVEKLEELTNTEINQVMSDLSTVRETFETISAEG